MDYKVFYTELFRPIEKTFGRLDSAGIFHIIGFNCGGPLNFSTFGREEGKNFITYVSCELCAYEQQVPSSRGRFELMCHCNDEEWVRRVLTKIGQMSLDSTFDHGHTIDISAIEGKGAFLCGVIFEYFSSVEIDSTPYCVLRVHGISAEEMHLAIEKGADALFQRLKKTGIYPNTDVNRT
ncbi:MAG TPA: suppressor of fused domain protein [Terriglobales bacterium]|jgi:hypothetical protein|nr:suppressor of fused domain protein [Terriglobales bacterium]